MSAPLNIVFDLDGTLVDSAPDIAAAVNVMLEAEGLALIDLPTTVSFIGNGLPKLVERVMRLRDVPPEQFDRLCATMQSAYAAAPADRSTLMPGVRACLEALQAEGHTLGICTNKPEAPARHMLSLLDLSSFFEVVVGGDTLAQKKPDPAPLALAFEQLGLRAGLYVGDSEVDAATAKAFGAPFALFTKGYRKQPAEELYHNALFDHFDAFGPIVAQMVQQGQGVS